MCVGDMLGKVVGSQVCGIRVHGECDVCFAYLNFWRSEFDNLKFI